MRYTRYLLQSIIALLLMAACGDKKQSSYTVGGGNSATTMDYIFIEDDNSWQPSHLADINPNRPNGYRLRVNRWGDLAQIFNDSNKYQYAYAERLGIDPIEYFGHTYMLRHPLVRVSTSKYYYVDSLTHSLPFLVPHAEMLLRDIGRNFIDSLASRGADGYRIRVTSLLRTKASVRRLRRVNINATDSSTHQFATTFDLSWNSFDCLDTTRTVNTDDLKWLLAEVLEDLRQQGRCMVKYEKKTHCFHITAIK